MEVYLCTKCYVNYDKRMVVLRNDNKLLLKLETLLGYVMLQPRIYQFLYLLFLLKYSPISQEKKSYYKV